MDAVINELKNIYSQLNNTIFNNKLPKNVVFYIGNKGQCSKTFKWHIGDILMYQLTISTRSFVNGKSELVEGVLIQMLHNYAKENGIVDTVKQKLSLEFVDLSKSYGIEILNLGNDEKKLFKDDEYIITEELKSKLENIKVNDEIFDLQLIKKIPSGKGGLNSKPVYTYICKSCGKEIKTKIEELHVHCNDCNEDFERKI